MGVKYVIEMNMKPYMPWLLAVGVRCKVAAGCAFRKRDAARLALSSGIEGGG